MPSLYCLSCNKKNDFGATRAKFCAFCGKPFIDESNAAVNQFKTSNNTSSKPQPKPTITFTPTLNNRPLNNPIHISDDNPENDAQSVPHIDKIDVSFNVDDLRPNRQSADSVLLEGYRGQNVIKKGKAINSDFTPRQKKKTNKKQERQLQQQFKDEFKSSMTSRGKQNHRDSSEIGE